MMVMIDQMVKDLKEAAEVSMGTEITIIDIVSIKALADQVGGRGHGSHPLGRRDRGGVRLVEAARKGSDMSDACPGGALPLHDVGSSLRNHAAPCCFPPVVAR